jgi:GH25 family lysozyme M1 (1,4-beta-N-acetylmuramidase)
MTDLCFVADMGSQNPVDFNKLKAASYNGVQCAGVILRATRSNCAIDKAFAGRAEAATKLGFPVGAYAFNTGESAQTQAKRFISVTASFAGILRCLDFEPNPSGSQMSLDSALEFLDLIDQRFGAATWLYSGSRIKQLVTQATDAQRDFLESHPLWGCEYGPKWKNVDVNGHPLPWENGPELWQFTDGQNGPLPHTFDGLEAHADLSVFQGSANALALVWPGAPKQPPPATPAASSSLATLESEILSLLGYGQKAA